LIEVPKLESWRDIGDHISNLIRIFIQDDKLLGGHYSKEYAIKKAAGKVGVRQSSRSTVPDLTLTGKMLNNFRTVGWSDYGVDLGFTEEENETKRKANVKRGFDMFDSKIIDKVEDDLKETVEKEISINIQKYESKPINIVIG